MCDAVEAAALGGAFGFFDARVAGALAGRGGRGLTVAAAADDEATGVADATAGTWLLPADGVREGGGGGPGRGGAGAEAGVGAEAGGTLDGPAAGGGAAAAGANFCGDAESSGDGFLSGLSATSLSDTSERLDDESCPPLARFLPLPLPVPLPGARSLDLSLPLADLTAGSDAPSTSPGATSIVGRTKWKMRSAIWILVLQVRERVSAAREEGETAEMRGLTSWSGSPSVPLPSTFLRRRRRCALAPRAPTRRRHSRS